MAFELLRSGKKNIQEAAESVGYDYVSSFSREFKKKYGYAPKEVKHAKGKKLSAKHESGTTEKVRY